MNPRLAHLLVCLYPRFWRDRYGEEFEAPLQMGPDNFRAMANVFGSALYEHLFPTPGLSMKQNSSSAALHALCVRAPWAMFALVPLLLLAGAYFLALLILWSGWKMFLPQLNTPFVPIDGFAMFYFGLGRLLYFGAPILIGWLLAFTAARQKLNPRWPALGLALIALIGDAAQVHTSRQPGEAGHVSLNLALGSSAQSISYGLLHVGIILTPTMLPYLVWRLKRA